jgi:hypothetical protein
MVRCGRLWLESAASCVCTALALSTVVSRDWIETLTGLDPDRSNGATEWAVVATLALTAIVLALRARRHWQALYSPSLG